MNSGVLTFSLLPHLSSSLTDFLPSLNLFCHSKTDAQFMQDDTKVLWSIPCASVAFFLSLKQNFIAYRSSKVSLHPNCIFEIHQLWQSGFSRVYSNCCYSCSFEVEIIEIGQLSHKMYSNNILNFQESTSIVNACTKTFWKFIEGTTYIYIYICVYVCVCVCVCVCLTALSLILSTFWYHCEILFSIYSPSEQVITKTHAIIYIYIYIYPCDIRP